MSRRVSAREDRGGGNLDLNLDQVNDGEKYKTGTEGCEDYVPGRRRAAAGMGVKREPFLYHDTDVAHYLLEARSRVLGEGS